MLTLLTSIVVLILGYFIYGSFLERIFKVDKYRLTPVKTNLDGVDYVKLPLWKIFLIQFLNIAGLGPIFGAIAGALWGPVAFLWIVLGSIFAGGVHDYFSGMLSVKHGGKSISEVCGIYLGPISKGLMRVFTVLLMIIVGAVFLLGPAKILADLNFNTLNVKIWVFIILGYYVLSTILPIDKLIGRLYPFFGFALFFMAISLLAVILISDDIQIPELTLDSFVNQHYQGDKYPIFPMLFITIACGAISGFHSTQSPLMARCLNNEKDGKSIFYGTMIMEGVVALIWAAISMSFFGGIRELNTEMLSNGNNMALIVNIITKDSLGYFGGILAVFGVIAAPITSGDTSFRSARLIVADVLNLPQKFIGYRLLISVPIFLLGYVLTLIDFSVVWRYFAWTNQVLATVVLWMIFAFLKGQGKFYWVAIVPALFMSNVVISYILVAPEGFGLAKGISLFVGLFCSISIGVFALFRKNQKFI
jgi:carbon starvation protein CstA